MTVRSVHADACRLDDAGPLLDFTLEIAIELGRRGRVNLKPAPGEAPSSWANAGTWIFEPAVVEHIPDERMDGSLERLVFPSLIADGFRVQGFPSDAYWMDVGTSERYTRARCHLPES